MTLSFFSLPVRPLSMRAHPSYRTIAPEPVMGEFSAEPSGLILPSRKAYNLFFAADEPHAAAPEPPIHRPVDEDRASVDRPT